ncbi:hypothetical protein OMP46_09540, partial [Acinetobacter baumannii]
MTVQVSDRLSQLYVGNGINTRFDFTFRAFEQEDETGIGVRVKVGNDFEFIDESEYAVTLNPDNLGGYVTFVEPPSAVTFFYIAGKTPVDQLLDITNYDNFYPDAIERALDKLTAILQEWKHLVDFETQARILADIDYDQLAIQREADLKAYIDGIASSIIGQPVVGLPAQFVIDGTENQKQINNKTIQYVDSISELRLLNPRKDGQEVFLVQHTSEGRGAGWFVWDAFDTQTDNNGTVVKRDGIVVGSWKRRFISLKTDDFGLHEATGDTTAILQLIDSLADTIVVNNGEYLISDFKPSKKYIFEDNAWFKTNTTATSNGVIAQTGLKMIRPKIKHNVSVAPTDGDYGNAIRIGTYRQANDLTVSVHDVVIDASEIQLINTTNVGQGIEILGNAYDVTISRPIIKGKGLGIICHWGGDVGEDGHSSTVTYSYHPHDIKIIDPEFYSTATDATGRMQTGLILSACYDVEVTNIKSDGVATTLYNFVGDVYNQVAVDRDKDKVCTNVKIDGVNIDNFVDGSTPVQAIGYSATVRTAQGMTIAIDDDQYMQMSMKGIVITSRNAANTSDLILVSGVKNVDFEAEIVGVEHDGRFARIQANQDCSIKITGSSKRGFINRGNHNTDITVNSVYKTKSRVPSERGMEIQSYEFVTSSFNAPQGSTSLSFSVATTTLLYKGSLVLKNNIPVGQVTKTAYFESGVVNTVQIDGLSEAITTSDAVKILRANDGCVVTGVIANYYNNVYGTNPVGTIIQSKLYGGYNGNIMFDGAYLINVDITDCKLEKVGLENSSMSCVDIT